MSSASHGPLCSLATIDTLRFQAGVTGAPGTQRHCLMFLSVVVGISALFIFTAAVHVCLSAHPGHLSSFSFRAVVNSTVVNMCARVFI